MSRFDGGMKGTPAISGERDWSSVGRAGRKEKGDSKLSAYGEVLTQNERSMRARAASGQKVDTFWPGRQMELKN